jgi:RNA polymerase sigma-70 factor (ECF subfamily)
LYSNNDDRSLLAFVKQGDDVAFRELYDRHWKKIFRYVYNCLHARQSSEEIVQEVFIAFWNNRDSIEITTSMAGYLMTAAKHKLLNELRSMNTKKIYADDFALFMENVHDNSNEEWQSLIDLENAVEDCLTDLPPKCQTVFRMSRQEHLPIASIAAKLNISTKTVENYLTQALKHLRTNLGEFIPVIVFLLYSHAD